MDKKDKKYFIELLGEENARFDEVYLKSYSYDATKRRFSPEGVLFPRDEKDVADILKYCNERQIIVVPRGLGSGFSGGALAFEGGVILALEKHMNKLLSLDLDNLTVKVQPGMINQALQDLLAPHGLFYPPDPASMGHSTLGGNVSENAGGMRAAKYGVTKDYVMSLRAVLPNGDIIRAGKDTIKDVAGLNLAGILIGSEGVLAVLSELTLKLAVKPKYEQVLMGVFPSIRQAMQAVYKSFLCGVKPVTMEFLDNLSINTIEDKFALGLNREAGAILLGVVDASVKETLEYEARILEACFKDNGAKVLVAKDALEGKRLLKARRSCSQAIATLGEVKLNEDITVPRSKLPDLLEGIGKIQEKYGFKIPCFGHAGDGNVHANLMVKNKDEALLVRAYEAIEELFRLSVSLGGTLSGEHGIGLSKAPFMHLAFTPEEMALMKAIKKAFDPNNILNPHKMGL